MPKVLISAMTLSGVEGEYAQVLRSAGFELVYPARPVQLVEAEMPEASSNSGVQSVSSSTS